MKKTHMPSADYQQAFMKVALNRPERYFRSEQSRSNVLVKYAAARRLIARLASEVFLINLQRDF